MGLTWTTAGTHFLMQPGGHGGGHEATGLRAQDGNFKSLRHAFHPIPDDTAR